MTDTLHDDPELEAAAARAQKQAARDAAAIVNYMRSIGYDHIVVRLARIVTKGEENSVPGATVVYSDRRMLPALPLEAGQLRTVADRLDGEFKDRGTHEAESGYSEDVSATLGRELVGGPEA